MNDDTTGDDASGNGTTSGAAGDWDTIRIDSGSSTFTYAFIRFGGNTGGGRTRTNFYVDGGTANLTHSEVASSTTDGIKETSGTTVINSSTIHGNLSHGVINVSGVTLNAQSNYWGASDGPGLVATGTGDHVSADVDYSGFLSSWP